MKKRILFQSNYDNCRNQLKNLFKSKLLECVWDLYRKIVSKYPIFKEFKPFRTNNWVYI